ncbi:MAG: HAMP domain-containing histidine kinase, partial [Bacilli bacterium]|nr:HAMP domain-containing histidine kinase [Bacilli bacterium]
ILEESVKKVLALSDLKNVKIEVNCDKFIKIKGDLKWEIEALTNIIKNSIEHAYSGSTVSITGKDNRIFSIISIKNQGKSIPKKEILHIFERFYKGQNSSKDSIGIGLALAKTIVEKDGGTISVESKNNETEFKIKYFN